MKKWYQSKTIWLNLVAFLLFLVPLIDADLLTAIGITNTKSYLIVLGLVTTVLNKINRMLTNTGIDTAPTK